MRFPAPDVEVPALLDRLRANGLPESVTLGVEFAHGLGPDPRTGKFRRVISRVPQTAADHP